MTDVTPRRTSRWARPLRTLGTAAIAIASVAYMGAALRHAPEALRGVHWLARPWLAATGVAVHALSLSLGCVLWWIVLDRLAPGTITLGRQWRIWAITNPTRYVPGRILHVTSLGALMRSAGVPVGATLTSIAIHMWLFVLAGCVVGCYLVAEASWPASARAGIVTIVVTMAVLGTHPRPLRMVSGALGRLSREPALTWTGSWGTGLALCAAHVGLHILTGIGACVMLAATVGLESGRVARVIAANAVAFLAGYLSLVPAGLGVREAAMTLLLRPMAPAGTAAADALILRTGATATELLLALVVVLARVTWR